MRTLLLAAAALSFSAPAFAQTYFLDDATVLAENGTQSNTDTVSYTHLTLPTKA